MRLPESARAVLLIGHAATVWRVHMSRMMRMRSMHGKRCLNQCAFCTANPLQSLTQSITESRHLHRTPSLSIALHHTPWQSITLHHTPSQSIIHVAAAAGAPFEHAAWLESSCSSWVRAGAPCSAGSVCARERGTWGCADADCQEDGELELLRRRRGLCTEGSRV